MATSKLSRIGEILIKKQFCTPEQIRNALGVQRELQTKKLGTILVELTYITKDQLARVLEDEWEKSFRLQKTGKN